MAQPLLLSVLYVLDYDTKVILKGNVWTEKGYKAIYLKGTFEEVKKQLEEYYIPEEYVVNNLHMSTDNYVVIGF